MPLFLKSIAPELEIFGNRQLFNFNKTQSSGESDSALTMINWFTPILNVDTNNTFEFLTPNLKGFRFNHSLSTTGIFGNFNFEKYDRFGSTTPLWGYDEQSDTINFYKPVANLQISTIPLTPLDASNKDYVDNKTWPSSQITDFDTQVRKSRLDQFLHPISYIDMNYQSFFNLPDPTLPSSPVTKNYFDTKAIQLTGAIVGTGSWLIDTALSNNQIISANTFTINWDNTVGPNSLKHALQSTVSGLNIEIASSSLVNSKKWLQYFSPNSLQYSLSCYSPSFSSISPLSSSVTPLNVIIDDSGASDIFLQGAVNINNQFNTPYNGGELTIGSVSGNNVGLYYDANINESRLQSIGGPVLIGTNQNTNVIFNTDGTTGFNYNRIQNVGSGYYAYDAVNMNQLTDKTDWFYKKTFNGYAGIGMTRYLAVESYFYGLYFYGYLNGTGQTGTSSGYNYYSIYCNDRILATEFDAYSSIKKKTILLNNSDIVESEAVSLLKQIPTVKYEYKDKLKDGKAICYGVIAENLNEVLPDYVNMNTSDFVPNIMQKCTVKTIDDITYKINIKSLGFRIDNDSKKLKLITQDKVIDVDILKIDKNYIKISTKEQLGEEEFVYGTYEICPTVSKPKLFELSMVVIQNLIKRVEELEKVKL